MEIILHRIQEVLTTGNCTVVLDHFVESGIRSFEVDIFWLEGFGAEVGRPGQIIDPKKIGLLNKIINWTKWRDVIFYLDVKFPTEYLKEPVKIKNFFQRLAPEKFCLISTEVDIIKQFSNSIGFKCGLICNYPKVDKQEYDLYFIPFEQVEKNHFKNNLIDLSKKIIVCKVENHQQIEWASRMGYGGIMINNLELINVKTTFGE